jgi:hypothetical protein
MFSAILGPIQTEAIITNGVINGTKGLFSASYNIIVKYQLVTKF